MLNRQRFDPDIEVKYHQIIAHMNQKNKVIEEFSRILKDLCDWEMFNSRNLDKFANSISKLLVGKDPLKDTFILFERILASKSEQANKMANSIKEDMLPFLDKAIDLKEQTAIRNQQLMIKDLKLTMYQKLRQLHSAEMNYKSIADKMKVMTTPTLTQSRQKIQQTTRLRRNLIDSQTYLTEVITVYNHTVQDYMLSYSKLCQQLSQIQTNRKTTIKESISKFIVFEMDAIKNVEYDLSRHAKAIEKMDDKLIITQRMSPFDEVDLKTIQLAKISAANYIVHLTQGKDGDTAMVFQTQSQKKLNQIKKFLDPLNQTYQIKKDSYTNLITDINQLLTQATQVYDIKTVKQIIYYSSNYFMLSSCPKSQQQSLTQITFRRTRIPLLSPILCHPIFKNQQFWDRYNSRLNDMVQKEIVSNTNTIVKKDEGKLSVSLLAGDIDFMKKLTGVPIVEKILGKYLKYVAGSSEQFIRSGETIGRKGDMTGSRVKGKEKEVSEADKVNDKFDQNDLVYF